MIKEELTLRVTDLETKAIAFCREKDVPYPITKYLVAFATEVTKELQKENAELKETLKTYNGCGDWDNDFHTCRVYLQHEELQMYIEQLTNAKEIIKDLLSLCEGETDSKLVFTRAEQFLSEVEK